MYFSAHKMMLCVCSTFFRSVLANPRSSLSQRQKHPIIFLKDVKPKHFEQLLQYMYHGEINVMHDDLAPLIEAARYLQVKGLSDAPAPPAAANNSKPPPPLVRTANQSNAVKRQKVMSNNLKRKLGEIFHSHEFLN